MEYSKKMRRVFIIVIPTTILLLLLLIGFQSIPLPQMSIEAMRNAGLQQTRSQGIAKNALILAYNTDSFTKTQAIGDLEVSLPLFEAGQTTLSNYQDASLQTLVRQTRTDYQAIDIAAKLLIAHTNAPVDKHQIDIILVHSHTYSANMTMVTMDLQQLSSDAAYHLFFIELGIDILIITLIIVFALSVRSIANKIRSEHERLEMAQKVL